jgi:phosphatidylinositol phospholipase C delta
MINHAMFQRNGRAGYVLKPLALRTPDKELLSKHTSHILDVTVSSQSSSIHFHNLRFRVKIISAQQLPKPKDANGREVGDKSVIDPFVEVTLHIPDWHHSSPREVASAGPKYSTPPASNSTPARTVAFRTGTVKNNGFNPVWDEDFCLPFDTVGDMLDLIFVKFAVRQEDRVDSEPLAIYCTSLGSLEHGKRIVFVLHFRDELLFTSLLFFHRSRLPTPPSP